MSEAGDVLDRVDESVPFVLAPVLRVMNQLQSEGLFENYVIGGSMAIMYYSEPFITDDVDFFCCFPQKTVLFDLGPIYKRLGELGYKPSGLYVVISGVPVQFLSADGPLLAEAMKTAVSVEIGGVSSRVFQLEYAIAIKVEANRAKDWNHIVMALNSAEPDMLKLDSILQNFGLFERWRKHFHA